MSADTDDRRTALEPPEDEHAMVGAYALDAVDDGERAEFELHLAGCPLCSADVPAFREVLARLARSAQTAPPADLVARTVRQAHEVRQDPPPRRRPWIVRLLRRRGRG
jgi:anti-sigma factor RsiW